MVASRSGCAADRRGMRSVAPAAAAENRAYDSDYSAQGDPGNSRHSRRTGRASTFSQLVGDSIGVAQVSASGGDPASVPTPFKEDHWLYNMSPDGSEFLLANSWPLEDGPLWIMPTVGGTVRRLGDADGHDAA